jgi:hypothetical protein
MYGRSTAAPHVRTIDPFGFSAVFAFRLNSYMRAGLRPGLVFHLTDTQPPAEPRIYWMSNQTAIKGEQ